MACVVNLLATNARSFSCGHCALCPFSGVSTPKIRTASSGLSGAGRKGAAITMVSPSLMRMILASYVAPCGVFCAKAGNAAAANYRVNNSFFIMYLLNKLSLLTTKAKYPHPADGSGS